MQPATGNVTGKVHVVHVLVTYPDIGPTVVDQQAGFPDHAQKQPSLHVHQHHGEDHAHQGGEQFSAVGEERLERDRPHGEI